MNRRTSRVVQARIAAAHGKAPARTERDVWAKEEAAWLSASEIACAVADAYIQADYSCSVGWWHDMPEDLRECLDRLEAVTRASAMRKVRP